jgi:hypothetical protein
MQGNVCGLTIQTTNAQYFKLQAGGSLTFFGKFILGGFFGCKEIKWDPRGCFLFHFYDLKFDNCF